MRLVPLGIRAELDAGARTITLLEPAATRGPGSGIEPALYASAAMNELPARRPVDAWAATITSQRG
jgi:hypothetical protein